MEQAGLLDDLKNEPVWSSYRDEDTEEVRFYNRITKQSQAEKPKDFDGYYVVGELQNEGQKRKREENSIYERTFGDL